MNEPLPCQLCEQDDPWLHEHCINSCTQLIKWYAEQARLKVNFSTRESILGGKLAHDDPGVNE